MDTANIEKIRRLLDKAGKYADAMIEDSRSNYVSINDGIVRPREEIDQGLRVRVLGNGWGVASDSRISIEELDLKVFENTVKRAIALSKIAKKCVRLADISAYRKTVKTKFRIDPLEIQLEQKIRDLKEIGKEQKMKWIKSTAVGYIDTSARQLFISSEGAEIDSLNVKVRCSIYPTAAEGAKLQMAHGSIGGTAGYEALKKAFGLGTKTSKRAVALLDAESPKGGKYTVILSHHMAGVMAHEAIGHTLEGDCPGSLLEHKQGHKVANEQVTIVDDPTFDANGYYDYDDEGVKSSRHVLIDKGNVSGFIHSRETAGEKPGSGMPGNARAEDYSNIPQVRMSNTFFGKGRYSVNDVFDVHDGIFVDFSMGGQTDPTKGSYTFFSEEGWIIKNGEKTKLLKNVILKGSILETLHNVDAVGNDLVVDSTGSCGKGGQRVPVGDGGPHVRITNVIVGGR